MIDEIISFISPFAKNYGVKKISLFGSYAKGTQTDAGDIDLLIDIGNIRGLFVFNGFVNALSFALEKPVDVMIYNSLKTSLIKDSVENEVVLYEQ